MEQKVLLLEAERIIKLAKIFNNHKQKKLKMCRSFKSCGKYNYYWFPYIVPTGNKRATIIIWRNIGRCVNAPLYNRNSSYTETCLSRHFPVLCQGEMNEHDTAVMIVKRPEYSATLSGIQSSPHQLGGKAKLELAAKK